MEKVKSCPHCKKEVLKLSKVEVGVMGMRIKVKVCEPCKGAVLAAQGIGYKPKDSSKSVFPTRQADQRLEGSTLSPEEIARTQALKTNVRYQGRNRSLDNYSSDQYAHAYIVADGSMQGWRYKQANVKFMKAFRGRPFKIIHDNPGSGEIIAERIEDGR